MTRYRLAIPPAAGTLLIAAAACGPADPPNEETPAALATPPGPVTTFACETMAGDSFTFDASVTAETAELYFGERFGDLVLRLQRDESASEPTYTLGDDLYRVEDDGVYLQVDGLEYGCARVPGSTAVDDEDNDGMAAGIPFRALGQEPGWMLYIVPGRWIDFRYDYGQERARTPVPEPVIDGNATVWQAETEAHDLRVEIHATECQDVMSGESFAASVTVELDGERYTGCGEPLVPGIEPGRYCYGDTVPADAENGDVTSLTADVDRFWASGSYDWLPAEKDARRGSFEGVVDGETVQADYEFSQEGSRNSERIAIRLGAEQATVSGGPPELGLEATLGVTECE